MAKDIKFRVKLDVDGKEHAQGRKGYGKFASELTIETQNFASAQRTNAKLL